MAFWDVRRVEAPRGIKDPDAVLDYPISFADWLADVSDTYASHTVTCSGTLVCDSSSESAGVITVWLSGGRVGEVETFTIRITTTSGRVEDRTLRLRITER